ncbi:hypothetical protein H4R35_003806 [Dimargaris xerosporica]|nr:hypothetical protein H4R35_003806 [Dimargaris xerosporica]
MVDSEAGAAPSYAGYAVKGQGQALERFTYQPRPLGVADVEIHIDHCGICATDLNTIDNPWGTVHYPVIPGHEIVGRVVAVGSDVKDLQVGQVVGVGPIVLSCMAKECDACSRGLEPHCLKVVGTYGFPYPDGEYSQGGYARAIRVHQHFVIPIPEGLDAAEAAPLLCAGTTVFAPMHRYKVQPSDHVGVLGIGGLGHLAIQFARGFGAKVTAITSSSGKRDECLQLGATQVVCIANKDEVVSLTRSLDYLIVASSSPHLNWNQLASLMRTFGKIVVVTSSKHKIDVLPLSLLRNCVSVVGSLIGGCDEVAQMLAFAAKHQIRPWIQKLPMAEVNQGIKRLREGKVRYRLVLSNDA